MDRNYVLGVIEEWWASRYSERHGLVTSYDPDRHLAKVMFQPEQFESGWLPIETGHIGDNFGIAIGLTAGDGKTTGDQVVVRLQEGDFESGKIVQRVHSDQDKPPKVESGELVTWTRFKKTATDKSQLGDDTESDGSGDQVGEDGGQQGSGCQFFMKKDGSFTVTDGAGATVVMDGKGNINHTCKDYKLQVQGNYDMSVTGNHQTDVQGKTTLVGQQDVGFKSTGGNLELHAANQLGFDSDGEITFQGGGNVADDNVTPPNSEPIVNPFSIKG